MSANGAMTEDTGSDDGADLEPEVTEDEGAADREEPARRATDDGGERRANHRERRANKMKEANEARVAAESARVAAEERASRLERDVSEMRGYLAAQAERQRQDPNDSTDKRIDSLEAEADAHLERAAETKDPEVKKREFKLYHAKHREATILAYEARANPKLDERFQQLQRNIPDPQSHAAVAQAIQEFPWLATDDEAESLVNAKLGKLLQSGRPKSIATIREAATAVAKRLGLGGRSAPTERQRQSFSGVRGGEGGGGGGGGERAGEPEMNKANLALAAKAFPALEGKKRWSAFSRMVQESEDE
jgi:hypothetical protein